jgi:hypothetical protein
MITSGSKVVVAVDDQQRPNRSGRRAGFDLLRNEVIRGGLVRV